MLQSLFSLSSVGLLYDGIGVLILGYAFFSTSSKTIADQSGTYFSYNLYTMQALSQQKADGMVGTMLLATGFLLQWLQALGIESPAIAISALVILLSFLLLHVRLLRAKLIEYIKQKAAMEKKR